MFHGAQTDNSIDFSSIQSRGRPRLARGAAHQIGIWRQTIHQIDDSKKELC